MFLGHRSSPRNALNIANINNARCPYVKRILSLCTAYSFHWSFRWISILIPTFVLPTHTQPYMHAHPLNKYQPQKYCWKRIDRPWIPRGLLVCSAQIFGISKGIFICPCITLYNIHIYLYYRRYMTRPNSYVRDFYVHVYIRYNYIYIFWL